MIKALIWLPLMLCVIAGLQGAETAADRAAWRALGDWLADWAC